MEQTVIFFVNGKEIHKFKAKDSKIVATPLCLGKTSKDWSVDNMKKTGLNGYVYNFSIDYDAIAVDDILDIHNYLMKKKQKVPSKLFLSKDVLKTSWKPFQCNFFCLSRRVQDILAKSKTSWRRRLANTPWRRLENTS